MATYAELADAVEHGAVQRIRPKMMTVMAILLSLVPILWATGTGADVMRRIAAPMIGGVFTSFAGRAGGLPRRSTSSGARSGCAARRCSRCGSPRPRARTPTGAGGERAVTSRHAARRRPWWAALRSFSERPGRDLDDEREVIDTRTGLGRGE